MRLLHKTLILGAAAAFLITFPMAASADVIITEVVDATLPGGLPKFVEITNTGPGSVDLSNYSIGNYNNGGTLLGGSTSFVLSGTLAACDSWVISYENSDSPGVGLFYDTYGFDPDEFGLGAFINGDDVIALFLADGSGTGGAATGDGSDATMIDIYGVIGVDGSGEAWEYTDGYSYRNCNIVSGNGGTFVAGEWTIGGANSLETGDDVEEEALILALTDPGENCAAPCEPTPVENSTWGSIKRTYQ